jgi:hypothetical protein
MKKQQLAYGVLLPHEVKDRRLLASEKMMSAQFSIVGIDIVSQPDPTGVQKGTLITNPRSESDPYADLRFGAHVSWRTGELQVTGWDLEYKDVFSIDLDRATRMCALLKRIRKALDNLPVRPIDFGQYISLLGPSAGIDYMVRAEDEQTEARNSYPDGWYRILPIRDAQNYVHSLIVNLADKCAAAVATRNPKS